VWRDLEDWFLKYVASSWACIDWSVAQLGTMFPSKSPPSDQIQDLFADWLGAGTGVSIMHFSVAAERLVSWRGKGALDTLEEALRHADHPLYRRVIAISSVNAGAARSQVRGILNEFEENLLTRGMIESTSFKRVAVKRDFAGA